MATSRSRPNAWLWTIAALAGLSWGLIAVVFAALGPADLVPRLFHNYHAEHFAAFYVLAILACAAFARAKLLQIGSALAVMAMLLALIRLAIPRHQLADAEDLAADIAGIIAAMAPILVGRYRQIVAQESKPAAP
jgi:hypothetical protein